MQKLRIHIIIFFIILGSFSRAATPNQLSMENAAFLSGIYIITFKTDNMYKTMKVMLVK